jgi:arylsulfatase A-like enzyme
MASEMKRRELLKATGIGAAGLAMPGWSQGPSAKQQKQRPNILFIFSDDQRFDTIHALGNREIRTPNLDSLARRGVAFTQACIMGGTVGAVCIPSRGMLMTGQSLFHVHNNIIAPEKAPEGSRRPFDLFPELFRKAGYTTFGVGKWHNGPALYARCFGQGGPIMFGGMSDHLKVPIQDFDPTGRYPKERQRTGEKFSSELFADSAVRFLKEQKAGDPFLLYIAYTAPHDPRMPPPEYAGMYPAEKLALPPNFMPEHPFDNGDLKTRDEQLAPWPRTPEVVRKHIAEYYGMITHMDAQIGRVLKALEESGRADNTIIVFAGDNGLALGRHGLFGKQNVYDHSVRVPLIVCGPGIPRGKTSDALVYLLDLFPTLCDLAGQPAPATVEGQSLAPLVRDPKAKVRDSVFFAYRNLQRAVRTDSWKLIHYTVEGKETTQLFHIREDPWEMKNLAGNPAQAERVKQMTALLKDWMKKTDDPLLEAGG